MSLPLLDISQLKGFLIPPFSRNNNLWMTDLERTMVIALLMYTKAETVVEIGVQEGYLAFDVLKHLPQINHYYGVDLTLGSVSHLAIESQQGEIPGDKVGRLVAADSRFRVIVRERGSLDIMIGDLPDCEAAIIDGDHSAIAVRHDTELATAAVESGGVIMWHDYGNIYCGVTEVLDELAASGRDIRLIENTNLAVELR